MEVKRKSVDDMSESPEVARNSAKREWHTPEMKKSLIQKMTHNGTPADPGDFTNSGS